MKNEGKLVEIARKYVWWKTPEGALSDPGHFLAQVMTFGAYEDCFWLLEHWGASAFVNALKTAPAGVFNERSWAFWHYKLDLTPAGDPLPAMPKRHTLTP